MAADIHIYTEKKNRNGKYCSAQTWVEDEYGEFEAEYELYDRRSYLLFSIIAEVRGSNDVSVEPKGLPEDISNAVKMRYENDSDKHSASYLYLSELEILVEKIEKLYPEDDEFEAVVEVLNDWIGELEFYGKESRVVFWFDN